MDKWKAYCLYHSFVIVHRERGQCQASLTQERSACLAEVSVKDRLYGNVWNPWGTEHAQTVCTRLFFFSTHAQKPGNEASWIHSGWKPLQDVWFHLSGMPHRISQHNLISMRWCLSLSGGRRWSWNGDTDLCGSSFCEHSSSVSKPVLYEPCQSLLSSAFSNSTIKSS